MKAALAISSNNGSIINGYVFFLRYVCSLILSVRVLFSLPLWLTLICSGFFFPPCPFFSLQTLINSVYSCLIILSYLRGTFWSLINYCTGIFFSCIFEQSLFAAILATSCFFHSSFVGLANSCASVKIIKISLLFFHIEKLLLVLRSGHSGFIWKGTYITPACSLSHITEFQSLSPCPKPQKWCSSDLIGGWATLGT